MKEGVEKLYSLQLKDDKLREIENTIKEIPLTIKKLETERDSKAAMNEKIREKLNENIKSREKLEKQILLIKEKIKKYKDQMNNSTTNKEYQGFISEIKYEEENISSTEEKIIEGMVESDDIMNEIRKGEEEYNKIAEKYNKNIEDLKHNLEYNKNKLNDELESRETLRSAIPEKMVKNYDNLSSKKNGKAVSFVETDFCGICNVKIRPQRISELISTNNLSVCESCGCILFMKINPEEDQDKVTK